jgi:hypothetical protein
MTIIAIAIIIATAGVAGTLVACAEQAVNFDMETLQ